MANEIHADYASGSTLYAVLRNGGGQVWYPAGQVFEDWGTSSRDADDYDIAMAGKGGSLYVGDFDSNVPAGRYAFQVFLQAGANPADGDTRVGGGQIVWSGSGVVTAEKLLGNKAVQDKATGAISYYDDDGQSVLLSLTPEDSESEMSRTPG